MLDIGHFMRWPQRSNSPKSPGVQNCLVYHRPKAQWILLLSRKRCWAKCCLSSFCCCIDTKFCDQWMMCQSNVRQKSSPYSLSGEGWVRFHLMAHNLSKKCKTSFLVNFQIKTMSFFYVFSENEIASQTSQGQVAWNYTQTRINRFTLRISLIILLAVYHTVLLVSVWRICFQIRW